jgi:PII-like signaling protein
MSPRQFHNLSALRVYLRRGDNKRAKSWLGRLLEKPLSSHIVHSALHAGVTHASVQLGHMGFAKGAKTVAHDLSEVPPPTLPVCVELVAPRRILEEFIRAEAENLRTAVMVMIDAVHITVDHVLGEAPGRVAAAAAGTHEVRYITSDGPEEF